MYLSAIARKKPETGSPRFRGFSRFAVFRASRVFAGFRGRENPRSARRENPRKSARREARKSAKIRENPRKPASPFSGFFQARAPSQPTRSRGNETNQVKGITVEKGGLFPAETTSPRRQAPSLSSTAASKQKGGANRRPSTPSTRLGERHVASARPRRDPRPTSPQKLQHQPVRWEIDRAQYSTVAQRRQRSNKDACECDPAGKGERQNNPH